VEQVNRDFVFKRPIARRPGGQQRPCNKTRVLAAGLVVALLSVCGAIAAGLRINGTHSFPVGLYLVRRKRPEKGDLVFVNPPALPIFALARERGYLNVAYSAAPHLLKRLAGVAGDRVTIDSAGVQVNGIRLANSAPCNCCPAPRFFVGTGQVQRRIISWELARGARGILTREEL
jgi:type IV secretory pathway protease TraF